MRSIVVESRTLLFLPNAALALLSLCPCAHAPCVRVRSYSRLNCGLPTCRADYVYAFDHNVRSRQRKKDNEVISGGNAVQGPATVVHNDYTVVSAPTRFAQLTQPPKVNDTIQSVRMLLLPAQHAFCR